MAKTKETEQGWDTSDLNAIRVSGGKIDESGIRLMPKEVKKMEGKNGTFNVLFATTPEGKALELSYSSAKLSAIIDGHWQEIVGKTILITGQGVNFEREYHVKLV